MTRRIICKWIREEQEEYLPKEEEEDVLGEVLGRGGGRGIIQEFV